MGHNNLTQAILRITYNQAYRINDTIMYTTCVTMYIIVCFISFLYAINGVTLNQVGGFNPAEENESQLGC